MKADLRYMPQAPASEPAGLQVFTAAWAVPKHLLLLGTLIIYAIPLGKFIFE